MERFYKNRLQVQKRLMQKAAPLSEVSEIIEMVRDELRTIIPNAMNSVKAAFKIMEQNRIINRSLPKDMDPIEVNIGINSGTALVGMTKFKGTLNTRMTFTAAGTVTNIAARLSGHAQGGDILTGEATKQIIQGVWLVYDREFTRLKGVKEPLQIYSRLRS